MVRATETELPNELNSFFRNLKSEPCSANWDWRKILELLQSGSRHTNVFHNLFEAGIYHLLYVKETTKNSTIRCKSWHKLTLERSNLAGASFAFLMRAGAVTKRSERFKETLKQIVYSIAESMRYCFEGCGFSSDALQALTVFQEHSHGLKHLLPLGNGITDASLRSKVALSRTELLCSALRAFFEWGSTAHMPVCAPLISTLIATVLSVNCCDHRYVSFELISCLTRLLHSFSVILNSFGGILLPSIPAILTGLVYQLEWNSVLLKSQPSVEAILFRLSVYRALSSSACNASYFSSAVVRRTFSRLSAEVCGDISSINDLLSIRPDYTFQNSVISQDLRMCIVVAALLLVEHMFVQVPLVVITYMENDDVFRENFGDDCPSQKFKSSLMHLSVVLSDLVKKLIFFMNTATLSASSSHLLRPHLLISVLRVIEALTSHSSFTFGLLAYRNFVQLLLCHEDITVRTYARNVYSKCLQSFKFICSQGDKNVPTSKSVLTCDASVQIGDPCSHEPATCCQSTEVCLCSCPNLQPVNDYKLLSSISDATASTSGKRFADVEKEPLPKKPHLEDPQSCPVEPDFTQTTVALPTHKAVDVPDENPPIEKYLLSFDATLS
uniref:DUF5742 domain-containing protein n=1 Tax=Schistocephalus solidus TaxID=70667 RepID=A0A0V0J5L2_SCHSO